MWFNLFTATIEDAHGEEAQEAPAASACDEITPANDEAPLEGNAQTPPTPPANARTWQIAGLACIVLALLHVGYCLAKSDISQLESGISALADCALLIGGPLCLLRARGRALPAAWRSALIGLAVYLAFFVAITLFNAYPPALPKQLWPVLGTTVTVGYLIVLVFAIRLISRLALSVRLEVAIVLGTLLLYLCLNREVVGTVLLLTVGPARAAAISDRLIATTHPYFGIIGPLLLILVGAFLGQLLARVIRERNILVPVAIIAALIDFWGVYWGPMRAFTEVNPVMVTAVASAKTVTAAPPAGEVKQQVETMVQQLPPPLRVLCKAQPPESIGIGDFVFLAFFLVCASRLSLSLRGTTWGIFTGLLAYALLVAVGDEKLFGLKFSTDYIPGLPFICGGMLVGNLLHWRLRWQEWAMTGVLVAILAGLITLTALHAESQKVKETRRQLSIVSPTPQGAITKVLGLLQQGSADLDAANADRAREFANNLQTQARELRAKKDARYNKQIEDLERQATQALEPPKLLGHATVAPLVIRLTFMKQKTDQGPQIRPLLWFLYAQGYAQPADPRTTWEYVVQAKLPLEQKLPTPVWLTSINGNCPLRDLVAFGALLRQVPSNMLAQAREGRPVPEHALTLLEDLPGLLAEVKADEGSQSTLLLTADGALLTSDEPGFLRRYPAGKQIPYPAAPPAPAE